MVTLPSNSRLRTVCVNELDRVSVALRLNARTWEAAAWTKTLGCS